MRLVDAVVPTEVQGVFEGKREKPFKNLGKDQGPTQKGSKSQRDVLLGGVTEQTFRWKNESGLKKAQSRVESSGSLMAAKEGKKNAIF
jgi:hypothetical protein